MSEAEPLDRGSAHGSFAVRASTKASDLSGCFVEVHVDGSVVLVVDGERLFRFPSLTSLLAQYDLVRGDRQSVPEGARGDVDGRDLAVAEIAAAVEVAAVLLRPRAQKAMIDARLAQALERVREARARIRGTA